jgi:hypothetical protein
MGLDALDGLDVDEKVRSAARLPAGVSGLVAELARDLTRMASLLARLFGHAAVLAELSGVVGHERVVDARDLVLGLRDLLGCLHELSAQLDGVLERRLFGNLLGSWTLVPLPAAGRGLAVGSGLVTIDPGLGALDERLAPVQPPLGLGQPIVPTVDALGEAVLEFLEPALRGLDSLRRGDRRIAVHTVVVPICAATMPGLTA